MAVDKATDSAQLDADLTSVANAIRTKGGTSAQLAFPADFVSAINAISGGGGGNLKYKIGSFTLASDTTANPAVAIAHGFGEAPKVVVIWTEEYSTADPPSADLNYGYVYLVDITDMQQQFSSTSFGSYPLFTWFWMSTAPRVGSTSTSNSSYAPSSSSKPDATNFYLIRRSNSTYWRSGITYKYFVSEKWWS